MKKKSCWLIGGLGVALLVYGVGSMITDSATATPPFEPQVVIRRSLPPIEDAPTVPANVADKTLREAELVLGVTIDGESRAYPINMLTGPQREIINDQLAGTAIAVTW